MLLTGEDFTLEDQNFNSDDAVGGLGFRKTVINVRTQGMQGNAPLAVPFGSGHLRAAQTAGTGDPDPLGAKLECRGDAFFHGAAEGDPAFQLESYVFGNQLSIQFRLANLMDVDEHFLGSQLRQVLLY